MRKRFCLAALLFITLQFAFAQNPVIGPYPAATISSAGGNATVTPANAPINAVGMSATTTPFFKGSFTVSPATGLLNITNAYPAGTYLVKVKAWNANGLTTDSFRLTVGSNNCSQGSMLTSQNTAPASRPYNVALADFNGDGHQDLVTANYNSGNASVRLGNGAGGFTGSSDISMIYDASEIATADFNGDGKQDIIAGGSYNTSAAVRLGNGNGTFGPVTNVTTGEFTRSIATADFNNDGRADVAVATGNPLAVLIRLSDGAGGFINAPNCAVTGNPQKVVPGDFNNDGNIDLAISVSINGGYNYTVYTRFGDGNGNFYGGGSVDRLLQNAQIVSVADMNNDGYQDIVSSISVGYVYVYLGNGTGNFTYATDKYVGNNPIGSAVADFNGDGKMDVVVANYSGSNWATLLGNGAGGLSEPSLTGGLSAVTPTTPVAGDFNEDGLMDLAIPDFGGAKVMIVLNRVAEINVRGNNTDIPDGNTTPAVATATDFGDVSNRLSRTYIIQNTGIGVLTIQGITPGGADSSQFIVGGATFPLRIATNTSVTFTVTFVPTSAGLKTTTLKIANDDCDEAMYDFALQGNAVAVVPVLGTYAANPVAAGGNVTVTPSAVPVNAIYLFATTSPNFQGQLTIDSLTGTVKVVNAKPAGTYVVRLRAINGFSSTILTFNLTVANPVCGNPATGNNVIINQQLGPLCIADFDGDGKQDFATPAVFGNNIHLRFGNDSAGFTGGYYFAPAAGNTVYALAAGDVNGDGRPDLLSTGYYSNVVHVLLNNGPGTFRLAATVPVGEYPIGVIITDVNNDSRPDFITSNYNSKTASVRLGDGLGNFTGTTEIALGLVPTSIYAADFNNDGNTDFITTNSSANLTVRLGNGSGGFTAAPTVTIPSESYQLALADFNGDGKTDIASANNNAGSVSIRLGSGTGTFTGTTNLAIGTAAPGVVAGDFNGDGKMDFAAGDKTSKAYLRYGDGTGNFSGYTTVDIGYETRYLAVSDFNNDGRQDLAVNYRTDVFTESVAIRPGGKSIISLQGNGADITSGSTNPDVANYTDFGSGNNITRTFSIRNTGTANLTVGSLAVNGADSALFSIGGITLPAIITPGSATTFTVAFSPITAGLKTNTLRVVSDNCDNGGYTFAIKGTGISPVLGNYPATVVNRAGGNVVVAPSAAPSQHQYVVATASPDFKGIFGVDSATGNLSITNAGPEGNYTIAVTAYNYEVKSSTTFSLRVNSPACSQALFTAADISQSSFYPYRVTVADFNNDGKQDFALASASASNVLIQLGNGAGGIGTTTTVPVSTIPFALAAGDFNGDNKQDFLASSATDSYVRIRLGDGAGGFSIGADVAMPGTPQSIAVADFNGDGRLDFVTENAANSSGIPLRLGNGRGGFTDGGFITQVLYASFVQTTDLNNDGKADLLVKNNTSGTISILLGNRTGSFSLTGTATAGANYKNLTTADFNNDGFQDIAALIESNNSVIILLGNGAGVFTNVGSIATGAMPQAMVTGDFNGDSNPDVAITSYNGNVITVATGNGLGSFGTYTVAVAANPQGIAGGDFNNDGLTDLTIATSGATTLAVRLGAQGDINVKGNNISIPSGSTTPSTANYTDFGNTGSNLSRTFIIQNTGKAVLTVNAVNITGADSAQFSRSGVVIPATIAAGDSLRFSLNFIPTTLGTKNAAITILSNDCDEAVYTFAVKGTGVVLSPQLGNYPATTIASAGGNTVVSPATAPADATNITASAGPDFKGQLRVDAATGVVYITNAQPAGTYIITVKVNGLASAVTSFTLTVGSPACSQGLFTGSNYYNAVSNAYSVIVTDLNNDGKQDIVYPGYGLSVRLGDGAGNYNAVTTYGPNANYNGLSSGDFNGDGKMDIVYGPNLYIGDGTGALVQSSITLPATVTFGFVAAGDYNRDGRADLLVSSTADSSVYTLQGNGAGGFNILGKTIVRSSPGPITVADFNNDGNADFAVATGIGFSVRLGDGTGNFTGTTNQATGAYPYALATADLNRDGFADLLIANTASSTVAVRLGDGTGSFASNSSLIATNVPYAIATGDFNGDTQPDLLVANYGTNTVMFYPGDGAGNLGTGISATTAAGSGPTALGIGDFNSDGRLDMAIGATSGGHLVIRLGGGNEINVRSGSYDIPDGSTTTSTDNATDFGTVGYRLTKTYVVQNTGQTALTVSAIRFSGADSASFTVGGTNLPFTVPAGNVASYTFTITFSPTTPGVKTTTVSILNNDCDEAVYDFVIKGTAAAQQPSLGSYPATTIAAGGNISITPTAAPANAVQVTVSAPLSFKGKVQVDPATGIVSITNAYPAGVYPIGVKVQGISGFTNTFLLTVSDAVCSQGVFAGTVNGTLSGNPYNIVLGDFNRDGKQDFATANFSGNNLGIGLGDGAGNFTVSQSTANMNYPWALAIADFNSDGNQDLVVVSPINFAIYIRYGNGAGGFTGTYSINNSSYNRHVAVGDFNGDGRPDFATVNYSANTVSVFIGDGAGGFTQQPNVACGTNPVYLLVTDCNSDSKQDIIVGNSGSSFISVLAGDGTGRFSALANVPLNGYAIYLVADDVNRDGKTDLVAATNLGGEYAGSVQVFTGDGTGGFNAPAMLDVGGAPTAVAMADFNGDGKTDLAAIVKAQSTVVVKAGDGAGNFSPNTMVTVPSTAQDIAIGDLNGDSKLDILTANYTGNTYSARLNSDKEINLLGNGNAIASGSNATQAANLTNFGAVPTGNTIINTYTIQNTGTTNLVINNITISSTDSAAFIAGGISFPLIIAARSSTTFTLAFAANGNGVKTARVNVLNNDCDEGVYSFAIRGLVTCIPAATPNVWLGNTPDWNDPVNWSLGMPPGACTRAVINAGVPFMPEITGPAVCYSLTLSNGATIIIRTGGNLNITSNG